MDDTSMRFDDPATWPARWIDRCEIISSDMEWPARDGSGPYKKSAMQIFNSSPTGELFQVHDWFIGCLVQREIDSRISLGECFDAVQGDLMRRIEVQHAREIERWTTNAR